MIINLSHACFKLHIIFILGSFTWVIFVRRKIEMGFIMLKKIHLISITENSKMIEQRGNFFGGRGLVRGRWGGTHPLLNPLQKDINLSLTMCRWRRVPSKQQCGGAEKVACLQNAKDHTMASIFCQTLLLTEFLPKKQPQSPNGQKLFYRQTKNSQVQIIVSGLLKNESCNVQY